MCLHIKLHNEGGITLLFAQHHDQGIILQLTCFFTCGVGYSVVTYNWFTENMEMVVSSVETHMLSATDKELPIQSTLQ